MTALVGPAPEFGAFSFFPSFDRGLGGAAKGLREELDREDLPTFPARTEEIFSAVMSGIEEASPLEGDVDLEFLGYVVALIESLPPAAPLPRVVVQGEHEVVLDWDFANDAVVSVTVDGSDRLGYSALIGRESAYGLLPVGDSMPKMVRTFVARAEGRRTSR